MTTEEKNKLKINETPLGGIKRRAEMKRLIMVLITVIVFLGTAAPAKAASVVDEVLNLMSTEYLYSFDKAACEQTIRRAVNEGFKVSVKGYCMDPYTYYITPANMLRRPSGAEAFLVEFKRGEIYFKKSNGVLYIRIKSFEDKKTPAKFRFALEQADISNPLVVIDLRGNPGGFVWEVAEMLRCFGKKNRDTIVSLEYRNGEKKVDTVGGSFKGNRFTPASFGRFKHYRVAILVNDRSMSAAEIFAGVMKEWGFPVVGLMSYGKGISQQVCYLSNGGGFRMTNAKVVIGNERTLIHGIGIAPTNMVRDTRSVFSINSDTATPKDRQFMKAVKILKKMK